MRENGLLQKMKMPVTTAMTGVTLLTTPIISQAQKAEANPDLENKTNTTIIINYVNPPQRFFINDFYWNFYNFDPRLNRVNFRRYHNGNYVNFYLGINQLPGYGIHFNYQTPFHNYKYTIYQKHNKFNNQYNNQFFNQNKINHRIRNNTGRR